jgi:hypothetical protein
LKSFSAKALPQAAGYQHMRGWSLLVFQSGKHLQNGVADLILRKLLIFAGN